MSKERKKIAILALQLEEWRRKDSSIGATYDAVRNRTFAILGIELGLTGYFITQIDKIIKPDLYGILFFALGALLGIAAIVMGGWNYVSKKHWISPMYDVEIEKMNNAEKLSDAYQVLVDDYHVSYDNNMRVNELASKRLNWSLLLFIGYAIILVVLNFA